MLMDGMRTRYAPLGNIEHCGGRSAVNFLQTCRRLQVSALALSHGGDLVGDHCPLALIEMPSPQVHADDVAERVSARVGLASVFDPRLTAGPITVAPVEDLALKQHYGLFESLVADIGDKGRESLALHQREDICQRVKL